MKKFWIELSFHILFSYDASINSWVNQPYGLAGEPYTAFAAEAKINNDQNWIVSGGVNGQNQLNYAK